MPNSVIPSIASLLAETRYDDITSRFKGLPLNQKLNADMTQFICCLNVSDALKKNLCAPVIPIASEAFYNETEYREMHVALDPNGWTHEGKTKILNYEAFCGDYSNGVFVGVDRFMEIHLDKTTNRYGKRRRTAMWKLREALADVANVREYITKPCVWTELLPMNVGKMSFVPACKQGYFSKSDKAKFLDFSYLKHKTEIRDLNPRVVHLHVGKIMDYFTSWYELGADWKKYSIYDLDPDGALPQNEILREVYYFFDSDNRLYIHYGHPSHKPYHSEYWTVVVPAVKLITRQFLGKK